MAPDLAADSAQAVNGFLVDSLVPEVWDPACGELLDSWAQGFLLERVPVAWSAPAADDAITAIKGTGQPGIVAGSSLVLDWAVIASQTCDIAGSGPGRVHPFVQVVPLVDVSALPKDKIEAILNYEVTYFAPMNPPGFSGVWAADLRLLLPVSKGLLLERTPKSGFAGEGQALAFSEHLAARLRRPALHDLVSEGVVGQLAAGIKSGPKATPEWWQNVEQLRVLVTGPRLAPSAVQILVVSQVELSAAEKKQWRDMMKPIRGLLRPAGISIKPFLFAEMSRLSATLYLQSLPLYVKELQRPRVSV